VFNAVNLGGDTDTTGAVTGGLAGIYQEYTMAAKIYQKTGLSKLPERRI